VSALSDIIGWPLAFFYSFIPNLGICIILLTCTVMLALFPLTAKQAKSMIAMQRVQPEIKRIQAKYKDDRQKQNEEVMRFYQENKINPLSGCLPLLMQMPVFIALFGLLRKPQNHIPTTGRFSDLYHDICGNVAKAACENPKGLHFLSMDLSISPAKANTVTDGFLGTLPYFIMVALVIATGFYQARQTMARQAKSGAPQTAMTAQMQIIGKVMPVAFGLISLNFASGLIVYFVTSNLWRIGQQQLVLNKMYDQAHSQPALSSNGDDKPKASPPTSGTGSGKGGGGSGTGSSGGGKNSGGSGGGAGGTPARKNQPASGAAKARSTTPPRARQNPNTSRDKRKRKR
jgi:YidC/Oxa1 family membrane protein insertase